MSEKPVKVLARNVHKSFGRNEVLRGVDMEVRAGEVACIVGPSGGGKSTFLRCINRMNDTIEGCRVEGVIKIGEHDIYAPEVDVVHLRSKVGMVFQKPNPFPKSIYDNVAYGPRIHGTFENKQELDEMVEKSLVRAGLWDEVKDRLNDPGTGLSGGQQQRVALARALVRVMPAPDPSTRESPTPRCSEWGSPLPDYASSSPCCCSRAVRRSMYSRRDAGVTT